MVPGSTTDSNHFLTITTSRAGGLPLWITLGSTGHRIIGPPHRRRVYRTIRSQYDSVRGGFAT